MKVATKAILWENPTKEILSNITDNKSSEQFLHGAVSQEWLQYLIGSKKIGGIELFNLIKY